MEIKLNKSNVYLTILIISCIMSVLTQSPILIGNKAIKSISLVTWMTLFLMLITNSKIIISKTLLYIISNYIIFMTIIIISQIYTSENYLGAIGVYPLNISIFIFFIGYMLTDRISVKQFKFSLLVYAISTIFIVFEVYFSIKDNLDLSGNFGYLYTEKNSISTIALTSLMIFILVKNNDYKIFKSFKIISIIFLTYCIIILKSRATIVSALGTMFIYTICNRSSVQKKVKIFIISIFIGIIIFSNENLYSFFIEKLLLNKMETSSVYNMYTITSGRSEHFDIFFKEFINSPLIGYGYLWIESFPLVSLVQFGIIGAIPLILVAIHPLICSIMNNLNNIYKCKEINDVLLAFSSIFIINSLFEAAAPFGPGVKCFILWLVFGYNTGLIYRRKDRINA